jgi:hypothetical protein
MDARKLLSYSILDRYYAPYDPFLPYLQNTAKYGRNTLYESLKYLDDLNILDPECWAFYHFTVPDYKFYEFIPFERADG